MRKAWPARPRVCGLFALGVPTFAQNPIATAVPAQTIITVNASGLLNVASDILEHNRSGTGQADGSLPSDRVEPRNLLSTWFEVGMRSVQEFGDCLCNPVELRIMR